MKTVLFLIIIIIIIALALYNCNNTGNVKEPFIHESLLDKHDSKSIYKKYFVMPLESDDYDTPLLDDNKPTNINKYNDNYITYGNIL